MTKAILIVSALFLPPMLMGAEDGFSGTEWDAASQTAVVYNPNFPDSEPLARYYAEKRHIPPERLVALPCPQDETVSREVFDQQIRRPLQKHFVDAAWWRVEERDVTDPVSGKTRKDFVAADAKIRVLVMMRGVPLRVSRQQQQAPAAKEDDASVDSELAALGMSVPALAGAVPNPYFGSKVRFTEAAPSGSMLLVGRLDAASSDTVRRMIDDAIAVESEGLYGRAVIDMALKTGGYAQGEQWLTDCTSIYKATGIPVYVEKTADLLDASWPLPDTALYFGWYASEVVGPFKRPDFRFRRGAVACHLHSFSAHTLRNPETAWAAPLLERGAAATFGNVWEPYLSYTVHFNLLNERLLAGYTLAEAAWGSTPALSWMTVVLGDPLYRPFANRSLPAEADRDYALLRGLAEKYPAPAEAAHLKRAVVTLAEKRNSPRLLEMLALIVAANNEAGEAASLLEHARAVYASPADQARALLYQIDILRRSPQPDHVKIAEGLLKQALTDPSFAGLEAFQNLKPREALSSKTSPP